MSVANELPACIQYNMWCEKKNYIRWMKTVENEEIERKRRRRFAEKGLIPLHFSYIFYHWRGAHSIDSKSIKANGISNMKKC